MKAYGKATLAVAAATIALVSSGCSSEDADEPTGTYFTREVTSKEDRLMHVVRSMNINVSKNEAIDYAKSVCSDLEDGFTSVEVMMFRISEIPEMDYEDHAALVGGSGGAYCPQFAAQIMQEWG